MAEYTSNPDLADSSAYKSLAWRSQSNAWKITADLWESPLHIRERGEDYLDKFEREPDKKYKARLSNSVFTNKFRESIESMAGTVFRTDPSPTEAPKPIQALFTDIDGCGNSLHQFLLKAFELFLRDGNGYFYIDAPPPVTEGKPTYADRINDRPWITYFTASQLINHRYELIGGRSVLAQATFEKKELEADGQFGEKEVCRHLILTPGFYEVKQKNDKDEWVTIDGPTATGLTDIPLIPITEIGNVPPLLTLAMLNLLVYNKVSDFDDWCHLACVPERYYKFSTKQDADDFTKTMKDVGPGRARVIWGEHAEVGFNEISGDGVEAAHKRIEEIDTQIAGIGIGMFAPTETGDAKSATEIVDTSQRRQSKLARYTREFENAVEKAFYKLAEMINIITPGMVEMSEAEQTALRLKLDYARLTFSLDQLKFFAEQVAASNVSRQTFWQLLQNIMDMPDGWTADEEKKRLADEKVDEPPPVVPLKANA